jgi:NAD(P)-dependent dehydrogenase (short-subunit alcohol dehydrogenase family)
VIEDEQLDIEVLELDVTKVETIDAVVQAIIDKDGRINILINNAGAGFAKPVEQASLEEIRWVTEVNYHGVVYCTRAVLPYMRKQRSGRIISVTSVGGLVGQPFNELYCGAKFAVEGFVEALATYLDPTFNIKFSTIEPGGIATEFFNSAAAKTIVDGELATGEYKPIFEKYMSGNQRRAQEESTTTYQTPDQVADVILRVAEEEQPPLRTRTSDWSETFTRLKTQADPDGTKLLKMVRQDFL